MIYANVFGKIAGVIFYVCIGISVCLLAYSGVRKFIDFIHQKRKLKQDIKKDIEEDEKE